MSTEPEEMAEENPEKKIEIERIPEPMFGGTPGETERSP